MPLVFLLRCAQLVAMEFENNLTDGTIIWKAVPISLLVRENQISIAMLFKGEKMDEIYEFSGEYSFLSNFWPSPIVYEGIEYPTVEHAFQAAKCDDIKTKKMMAKIPKPGKVKKAGRELHLKPNWEKIKEPIMLDLLRLKFKDPTLRQKLIDTGDAELIEGNWWNDVYWGVCKGVGENRLGELLMQVRNEIKGP